MQPWSAVIFCGEIQPSCRLVSRTVFRHVVPALAVPGEYPGVSRSISTTHGYKQELPCTLHPLDRAEHVGRDTIAAGKAIPCLEEPGVTANGHAVYGGRAAVVYALGKPERPLMHSHPSTVVIMGWHGEHQIHRPCRRSCIHLPEPFPGAHIELLFTIYVLVNSNSLGPAAGGYIYSLVPPCHGRSGCDSREKRDSRIVLMPDSSNQLSPYVGEKPCVPIFVCCHGRIQ